MNVQMQKEVQPLLHTKYVNITEISMQEWNVQHFGNQNEEKIIKNKFLC